MSVLPRPPTRDQWDEPFGPWRRKLHRAKQARQHYGGNLWLIVMLIVGAIVWFNLHLADWHTESWIVGAGLLVLTGVKVAQSLLGTAWPIDPSSFTSRVLQAPSARPWLLVGAGMLPLLFLATSSLHVEFDGSGSAREYRFEIWQDGHLRLEPMTIASYDSVKGQVFPPHLGRLWRPAEVEIRIVEPFGYEPLHRSLYPWSAVRVDVPGDFQKKEYRICRLVPGRGLLNVQPRVNEDDTSVFSYRVLVDRQEWAKGNLMFECVSFGAGSDVIEALLSAEDRDRRYQRFYNYLLSIGWKDDPARERARILAFTQSVVASPELRVGQTITVEFGWGNERTTVSRPVRSRPGIQDIFLEVPAS